MKKNAEQDKKIKQALMLERNADVYFSKRESQNSLKKALKTWQSSALLVPNARIYSKLARGYYFLGDAFYVFKKDDRKRNKNFIIGLGYAEKSLRYSAPNVIAQVDNGVKFYQAVRSASKEAVPAMYWYAACLSKWASLKGFITYLRYKDDIKSIMDTVEQLSPYYFFAGSYRYSGMYHAITAGLAGGSLRISNTEFAKAVKIAPDYLGTKVLWAQFWAVRKQDRQIFERLIREVLEANLDMNFSIIPENKIAQVKAKRLLANIENYF